MPPLRGIDQGGPFCLLIGPKNTNLVEDVEILLPVKLCWNPFSGFRGEVENISANQKPGWPSCISNRQEKDKLGRGRWDLASCQLSLNSVHPFQRRSRKCLSQSEARAAILYFQSARKRQTWKRTLRSCFLSSFVEFRSSVSEEKSKMSQPIRGKGGHLVFVIGPKKTNLVEDVEILLPLKFLWIPFSVFRGRVENVSANQRPGRPSCFSDRPKKHKLGREHWDLASYQILLNSVQRFQRKDWKCLSQSEASVAIFFSDRQEKDKLGRGRWDLVSRQVSLNSVQRFQRRSRKCQSQSEDRAAILFFWSARKTQNLVEDIEILLAVKFRWILFSSFRGEVENVSANQRLGWPSCFFDRPEKHKLGRWHWDLASCQVSLNSVKRFQRWSRKCEKLTTDRRTDRRRTTRDHSSALEPSSQVH